MRQGGGAGAGASRTQISAEGACCASPAGGGAAWAGPARQPGHRRRGPHLEEGKAVVPVVQQMASTPATASGSVLASLASAVHSCAGQVEEGWGARCRPLLLQQHARRREPAHCNSTSHGAQGMHGTGRNS
jgi:hypothetical protein